MCTFRKTLFLFSLILSVTRFTHAACTKYQFRYFDSTHSIASDYARINTLSHATQASVIPQINALSDTERSIKNFKHPSLLNIIYLLTRTNEGTKFLIAVVVSAAWFVYILPAMLEKQVRLLKLKKQITNIRRQINMLRYATKMETVLALRKKGHLKPDEVILRIFDYSHGRVEKVDPARKNITRFELEGLEGASKEDTTPLPNNAIELILDYEYAPNPRVVHHKEYTDEDKAKITQLNATITTLTQKAASLSIEFKKGATDAAIYCSVATIILSCVYGYSFYKKFALLKQAHTQQQKLMSMLPA